MNYNPGRKIKYVRITGEILEKEGMEGVSIRKVAERAGCTSAVLYKHFENKEHLIMLASIRFLEPYINEFMELVERTDISPLQMDLMLWKCFIHEAFKNQPYYALMFFSEQKDMLEECVYEYYQMFPEMQKRFDGFAASIIFSNNLQERELAHLRRASGAGLITMENARLLSKLSVAVFGGMFVQHSGDAHAAEECCQLIRALFQQFAKPGVKLDVD